MIDKLREKRRSDLLIRHITVHVEVAKLVDAHDSGSCGEILEGSIPFFDKFKKGLGKSRSDLLIRQIFYAIIKI